MEAIKFEELDIMPQILRAVKDMGFEETTAIQGRAIPIILNGEDVIGQAQTGTGKTAAFAIPMLQKINPKNKHLQGIILCPTRELAIQVADEIRKLSKYMHGIKILPIYGGQDIVKQIRSLKAGTQLVIGTPGRIIDHMRRKTVKFNDVNTVILDEADEMLNMGFCEDIETILSEIPKERQTILFSATMPAQILKIAKNYQKNAKTIKVVKKELTVPNIDQFYFEVKAKNKEEVLSRLLDIYAPKLSLVFCNTKKKVDELTTALQGRGYFAVGLHGDLKQSQRDRVMSAFRKGKADILVATDVAARGIDIDDVEIVFNYDLPQDDEYYVHRIGRTGRAGRTGVAFSFVSGKEVYKLRDIQRYCKTKIYARPIPSIDDVTNTRCDKILEKAGEIILESSIKDMLRIISERLDNEDYTSMELAAALLKMSVGMAEENVKEDYSDVDLDSTGAEEEGMVRLFINIGKKQKVKPGDILGAVAGESNMPGKLVGCIDMFDNYTFVEVPREYAKDVLRAMTNDVKIKGKTVNVEPANAK